MFIDRYIHGLTFKCDASRRPQPKRWPGGSPGRIRLAEKGVKLKLSKMVPSESVTCIISGGSARLKRAPHRYRLQRAPGLQSQIALDGSFQLAQRAKCVKYIIYLGPLPADGVSGCESHSFF